MVAPLAKLNRDLSAVLALAALEPAPAALVHDAADTVAAIVLLEEAEELIGATRLFAFALPRREAVWWAAMCAIHTATSGQSAGRPGGQADGERLVREAAENWVRQQDDKTRHTAMELARGVGFACPESWVAMAAFWSGDSMAPPEQPKVPPGPQLTGTAVAGAVALSAARGDAKLMAARLTRFLASARDIADGGAGRIQAGSE